MEYIKLGKSDLKVSRFAFGTWQAQGWANSDDQRFIEIVKSAIENGVTFFDTAESYGNGYSESLLQKALEKDRHNVVIASKFSHRSATPTDARKALEQSLRRLKTDYIDLYQYHWPSPTVPLSETIEAMKQFKNEGKIRAIGVSNWMEPEWEEFEDTTSIDTLQNCYSLLWRSVEKTVLPLCKTKDVSMLCYSPLAQGILAGRFEDINHIPKDPRQSNVLLKPEKFPEVQKIVTATKNIAKKIGKSVSQVSLRWLLDQPGVSVVIIGSTKLEQLKDNLGTLDWRLEQSDLQELANVSEELSSSLNPHDTLWKWHSRKEKAKKTL